MATYLVTLNANTPARILEGGADSVLVIAADADDAKDMAAFASTVDSADWANATATLVASPADLTGWSVRCQVLEFASGADIADVTHVGIGSDGIDEVGDALVLLLNALAGIANSAYDSATQILTISSIADAQGDNLVQIGFFPPGVDTVMTGEISGVRGFVTTVVDQGITAAVLTATFEADAYVLPSTMTLLKTV
jgi:hypothetical protein